MKYSAARTSLGRITVFAAKHLPSKAKRNQKLLVFRTHVEIPSLL